MTASRASMVRTLFLGLVLGLAATVSLPTVSQAETGSVSLVLTKAGLIVGASGGRGVLTFRGHQYRFKISGMSVGATIGASTTKLVGKAKNLRAAGDLAGSYSTLGAGGAVAAGVGAVRLQNKKGVVLELAGPKVGLELSAAVGGVRITME
jgi:lipid-binding SYLF domain-containing protein